MKNKTTIINPDALTEALSDLQEQVEDLESDAEWARSGHYRSYIKGKIEAYKAAIKHIKGITGV